ncbi:hypothetical protein HNP38_002054 [Chryseobacterium defluvii]|uniref:Uncharacterized protein n=1 Tax=Chryseobacterium defluvii TaxID=160396 RepID=A0A840KFF7_9FLAO|nr:hypothetical protein [Chryseobacterium defluvii]
MIIIVKNYKPALDFALIIRGLEAFHKALINYFKF